jgi:Skp family chaperone for outer membrane proteins
MRQAIWALIVIGALAIGFVGGQVLSGERKALARLQERVTALEEFLGRETPSRLGRIAVIQVNELALRYQENDPALKEQVAREQARLQRELERLQQQQQRGEITPQELSAKVVELQRELQGLQQQILLIVAGRIQAAATEVAREEGYDLVVRREDVIIYYRDTLLDDITEQVWERMQAMR